MKQPRGLCAAAAGALLLGAAGCVDFVAVEEPRSPPASGWLGVHSAEEADSIVVRLDGRLVGVTDPRVTLAGVPADTVAVHGDTLHLQGEAVLPVGTTRADLSVPFAPEGFRGRSVVRVGIVRRVGPAAIEGVDLVLPWAGPQVVDSMSGWSLTLERADTLVLSLGGPGAPPRPLRVPLSLLEGGRRPTEARMRLTRNVLADTFYPLRLTLRGETTWTLPGLSPHP